MVIVIQYRKSQQQLLLFPYLTKKKKKSFPNINQYDLVE